ncbi:MAG: TonB-dependent receptor plug domain-containing protein [Candidatus Poribacteria bacterium]
MDVRKTAAKLLFFVLGFCSSAPLFGIASPTTEVEEVVVTASRIPMNLSRLTRSVTVIDRDDIKSAPVHSIQDLLEYVVGVDLRRRGAHGVQSDVSVRGGTFEQTLILIDGIKVSDPQTGHHNLNLPLTMGDVERIEVLKGHGSRLYGPNAFGGVINIITKKGKERTFHLKSSIGEHGLAEGTISLSYPLGVSNHRLSLSRMRSTGYRKDTDFDTLDILYSSVISIDSGVFSVSIGHNDKEFGADSFYSTIYPNEWEHIKATFLRFSSSLKWRRVAFSPKLYWRRHEDDFVLDRDRPGWFRNQHETDVYGVEIQTDFASRFGLSASGCELSDEKIESDNLGAHLRSKGGVFLEQQLKYGIGTVVLGSYAYYYSDWGWKFWPGADFGFDIKDGVRFFGSIGRSFRVPTYTELYYSSPANKGNPNLKPEEAWTYEAGINFSLRETVHEVKPLRGSLSIFRREGQNLIDWVRTEEIDPWEARNIAVVSTNGVEAELRFEPAKTLEIQLGYALLDSDKETKGFDSKYLLDHLRHQFLAQIKHPLVFRLLSSWKLRYEERPTDEGVFLLDAKIFGRYGKVELFVAGTNLLDVSYTEVGGAPMPGRWLTAGLVFNLPQ